MRDNTKVTKVKKLIKFLSCQFIFDCEKTPIFIFVQSNYF